MPKIRWFRWWLAATAVACALGAAPARAAYPDRPIKFIVTFPPAGTADIVARGVAQRLAKVAGVPVIVENRPGAGGNIGMDALIRSAPDGYTIALIATPHAINMSMPEPANYDIGKDIAPVRLLVTSANVLVASPKLPANSIKELIELGKSKKIQLNYASTGNGTTPHVSGELLNKLAGIEMQHVPYKGSAPALSDVMGGQVELTFDSIATSLPHIAAGKLKALGVTSAKRSSILTHVPTIAESGLPNYRVDGWMGVAAPANTPPEIVEWLAKNIGEIYQSPEIVEQVKKLSMENVNLPPQEFRNFIQAEVPRWRGILTDTGIRPK